MDRLPRFITVFKSRDEVGKNCACGRIMIELEAEVKGRSRINRGAVGHMNGSETKGARE